MTDDLERIRALRDDAPTPSADWASRTRAELLVLAAEESKGPERRRVTAPGWLARSRVRLGPLIASPGRAAAAAASLLVVVSLGVLLSTAGPQDPGAPIAGRAEPPESESTPDPRPDDETTPEPSTDGSAAGAQADDRSRPGASTEDDAEGAQRLSSCQGDNGAYTISYPEDWHTNAGEVAEPCRYFDQEPVELAAGIGGAPEHPITVRILPVPLDQAAEPGSAEDQATRRATRVASRDAVVVEGTATGDGAIPDGTRSYRYLIDLDGERTLLIAAHDLAGDGLADYRQVADDMAASLQLDDG